MKLTLPITQIELIQESLAEDYVHGRVENEHTPGTVNHSYLVRLVKLSVSIEKQTGVTALAKMEHTDW